MTTKEVIAELQWIRDNGFENNKKLIGTDRIIEAIDKAIECVRLQDRLKQTDEYLLTMDPYNVLLVSDVLDMIYECEVDE